MDSSTFADNIDKEKADPNLIPESGNKRKDGPADGGGSTQPDQPKRKPSTRSTVWGHFTRFDDNVKRCKCNYCHKSYGCDSKSGTSHLKAHMESCKHFQAWKQKQSQTVINSQGQLQSGKVTEEVFREASNEMIVLSELPLAFIESIGWKHFCNRVNLYKPHSRRTATKAIVRMYVEMKASLRTWIVASKPRVSLTTDIWVAKATGSSYMVITAHFIDVSWRLRKLIIGFKYITDHKGATISRVLLDCLAEWGIEKILTVTVDNATANTSALKKFQEAFSLRNSEAFVLNGESMHMRCCAHIINLIVRDGLHELSENVTAIRNAVQYVRSSTSRCDSFEQKVVTGKMTRGSLPLDIKTRWNSTYLMLSRAIDFRLAFDRMEAEDKMYNDYFNEVENGKKKIGPPTRADWSAVERLVRFLIIFYNSTLVVSASTSVASSKCYGEIVTIERNLMSLSNSIDTDLKSKADAMLLKFEKYWDGMRNINVFLIVASVFDPRKKMQFAKMCFDKLYGKDTTDSKEMSDRITTFLTSLFKEYSSRLQKVPSGQSSQSTQTSTSVSQGESTDLMSDSMGAYERMDFAYKELVDEIGVDDGRDELDVYLNEKVENPRTIVGSEWDVLSWWRLNCGRYPVLSEIARDVLAMQVSSVASESAFSTSGRVIEPHRSCLTHYMVEVLICLQQWMKNENHFGEKAIVTNAQLLADIELLDKLEKDFEGEDLN